MDITRYYFDKKFNIKLALTCDLHGTLPKEMLVSLSKENPSYILIAGDFFHKSNTYYHLHHNYFTDKQIKQLKLLNSISPVIMSRGNHESHLGYEELIRIIHSGITFLDNEYIKKDGIIFGGLSSGVTYDYENGAVKRYNKVDTSFIDKFSSLEGYKILLCHHPEYYEPYLKDRDIDLIVCGHAHGGQIRIFNQGIYSPGQGFLPKYTSGRHGNMIISRGLSNKTPVPRIFNDYELIYIYI